MQRRYRGASAISLAVWSYAAAVVGLWLILEVLVDGAWPATLIAFGPRWLVLLPVLPLLTLVLLKGHGASTHRLLAALAGTTAIMLVGVMDMRLGFGRASGAADIRVMTQNLGGSRVTAADLDGLMRSTGIDVAALQECPFYDFGPLRYGWRFYYGGDLCLVSRFPFSVLNEHDPANVWRRGGRKPILFEIAAPNGRFRLLNLHFQTVRGGIEAVRTGTWRGLADFRANREDTLRDSMAARGMISSERLPLLVAGDFNLPIESVIYRAGWQEFRNTFSSCGRGFGYTKFTSMYGIRIDHILTSAHWTCTDARVVSSPYGGDHLPLIADLRLR